MPPLSKSRVENYVLEKLFDLFFEIIGNNNDKEEFEKIIYDVLSPVERIMIAKRIAIIYLSTKNIEYSIICEILKVSPATVAKFKLITENSEGIKQALKRIINNEKIVDFFREIVLELRRPGKYGVNWSQAWKDKLKFERKKETGI